jgi:hypothetical protein
MVLQFVRSMRLYERVCCFVLFFLAAAASFSAFYDECHFRELGVAGGWAPITFERMMDGTADRPYVYRQLLPTVANWVDEVAPQSIKNRLYDRYSNSEQPYFNAMSYSPTAGNRVYSFRYLLTYIVTFLFALLAVYFMHLVCTATDVPSPAAVFAPVIVILFVPYFMANTGFFYDYLELAFLALVVWMALKFDWWWAAPVVALGAWNKESFLLIIPTLYPIVRQRTSRLSAVVGTAALCSICTAIYYSQRLRFATNPGSTAVLQWREQIDSFTHVRAMIFSTQEIYGVHMLRPFTIIPMALLFWTAWRGWGQLASPIKRHGQIAATINLPLYFLFCTPGEVRDLSMLYIVLLLLLAANLTDWIKQSEQATGPIDAE